MTKLSDTRATNPSHASAKKAAAKAAQPGRCATAKKKGGPGAAGSKKRAVGAPEAKGGKARSGTKQEALINMLRRKQGATIAEMVEALSWQPHTVRGAMAGALRKKLGLKIESVKNKDRGRVYRIAG